jgi:hypothetical protein
VTGEASFVPDDFVVPRELVTAAFRLEPLGPVICQEHGSRLGVATDRLAVHRDRLRPAMSPAQWACGR